MDPINPHLIRKRLEPLPPAERITEEMVIGIYPQSETDSTAALDVPSRRALLRGTRLSLPKPAGNHVENDELRSTIAAELKDLLGGLFGGDIASYIELFDSLVSQEQRDAYAKSNIPIAWDEPEKAFYYLAFAVSPWQIQAVGEPGVFHCVFFGLPLQSEEAIGAGGHPLVHPAGAIDPLLVDLAPSVSQHSFRDASAEHATNLFDTYLISDDPGIIIKAGVRLRVTQADQTSYFYGIRINIDLSQRS